MMLYHNSNVSYLRRRRKSIGRLKLFVWILFGLVCFSYLTIIFDDDFMDEFASAISLNFRRRTFSTTGIDTKPEQDASMKALRILTPPLPPEEALTAYDHESVKNVDLIPTDLGTVAVLVLKGVEPRDITTEEKQVLEIELFFYLNAVLSQHMIQTLSVIIHKSFYLGEISQPTTVPEQTPSTKKKQDSLEIITPSIQDDLEGVDIPIEVSDIAADQTSSKNKDGPVLIMSPEGIDMPVKVSDNEPGQISSTKKDGPNLIMPPPPDQGRRTQRIVGEIAVSVFIRGKYFPPPFIDFNQEIKHQINYGGAKILSNLVDMKVQYPYFQSLKSIVCVKTKDLPINQVDQEKMKDFSSSSQLQTTDVLPTFEQEEEKFKEKGTYISSGSVTNPDPKDDENLENPEYLGKSKNQDPEKDIPDYSKYAKPKANAQTDSLTAETKIFAGVIAVSLMVIIVSLSVMENAYQHSDDNDQRAIDTKKGRGIQRSDSARTASTNLSNISHNSISYVSFADLSGPANVRRGDQRADKAKKGHRAARGTHRRNSNDNARVGTTHTHSTGHNSWSYLGFANSYGPADDRRGEEEVQRVNH